MEYKKRGYIRRTCSTRTFYTLHPAFPTTNLFQFQTTARTSEEDMESPPTPNSPSPSTPTSGDEETYPIAAAGATVNTTSPVPKRRAVAASGRPRRAGTGLSEGGKQGGQQHERKEELVDVAYMNDLRARECGLSPIRTRINEFGLQSLGIHLTTPSLHLGAEY